MAHSTQKPFSELSDSIREFSWKLYKSLSGDSSGNIFFSPFNIVTGLSLIFAGAKSNTAKQMSQVLRFNQIKEGDIHEAFQNLNGALLSPDALYTLKSANKLYALQGYKFLQTFLEKTERYYKVSLEAVDFKGATETTRSSINKWVSEQTNDKIKNLIPSGGLDRRTQLALVNAVYFKGDWLRQFNRNNTSTQQFHVSKSESIPVQMMFLRDTCYYFEDEKMKCQILSLRYMGEKLSMVIVLPNPSRSLSKLEAGIKGDVLASWSKVTHRELVKIFLPRFKIEESCFLKSKLSKMGMNDLFNSNKADLSGITEGRELFVSEVIHKAYIEVNEEGTEATAATALMIAPTCAFVSPVPTFKADHPFLFYITDNETNVVLFLGRVVRPLSK